MVQHLELIKIYEGLEFKHLNLDLKRTSLEEVFLLENDSREVDNDEEFNNEALDDCWKLLISETRQPNFFTQTKIMIYKSKVFFIFKTIC